MAFCKKLAGKVAIVTGGASGIGAAAARIFAENGALAVVIADIAAENGQAMAESIGSGQCNYMQCDVSDEEQVKAMVDRTVQKYGRLDVMFSNVGFANTSEQAILNLDLVKMDHLMKTNVLGTAACLKHAGRAMVEQNTRGSIVCNASVMASGSRGMTCFADYVASKYAVLGLVHSASQLLGAHGIRVNSVSPSAVATPLSSSLGQGNEEAVANLMEPFTSLKGVTLTARSVAESVLFLALDDSAYVSGQNLVVDGCLISLPPMTIN